MDPTLWYGSGAVLKTSLGDPKDKLTLRRTKSTTLNNPTSFCGIQTSQKRTFISSESTYFDPKGFSKIIVNS